jgi:quinol monooxygenase YgiN
MPIANPLRLVFVEQWADRAALSAHFAVPASRDFVRALHRWHRRPRDLRGHKAGKPLKSANA